MASEERLRKWIDDIAESKKFIQENMSMDGFEVFDSNMICVPSLEHLKGMAKIVGEKVQTKTLEEGDYKKEYFFIYKGIRFYELV